MRAALALALSATLILSACGDDSDSGDADAYADTPADQILDDALDAMGDLESVRISGTVVEGGNELNLDVLVSTSGECEGSVGMSGMGSFELLHLDGVSYFKPDAEFWRSQAGDAAGEELMARAGDKWVTNSEDPSGFGELCDLDSFIEALGGSPEEDMTVEGTEELDGADAVTMAFTSDDGNDGVAFIAADDPHRLLRFDVDSEGTVDFTDFDADLSVEKPAPDDTFDLASLG